MQIPADTSATGPFAALSLIVAPAILTNATSLLVMSTSNRLARAVDLARELARELEERNAESRTPETARLLREITGADARSILLLRALRAVYAAMAGFAIATFSSLLGVVLLRAGLSGVERVAELLAIAGGVIGVGSVVWAAVLLVRETRIAVGTLRERVAAQQRRFAAFTAATAALPDAPDAARAG